ncbi:MAG: serine/threonine-protein kinase [Pseudomonadota bacterium]|nr:serine/threonine-protein kinase [Pseudomonadota bacterium]
MAPESAPPPTQESEAPQAAARRALPERFTLLTRLGSGAFGEVWRARDTALDREVAVKVVEVGPSDRRRVAREVAALRHVDLPGVVRLLDAGSVGAWAWMSMEIAVGEPFPGRPGPVDWTWLAPRVDAFLLALGRLHGAGLVHRDLKPSNVLVDGAGAPTILDLGLARGVAGGSTITRTGALLGTPRYMSPEQCRGRRADARSDLYAVGVLIHQALTGSVPHASADLHEVLRRRASTPADPIRAHLPGLPEAAAACIDALLALEPVRRPPTAEAARRLLHGVGQRAGALPLIGRHDEVGRAIAGLRAGARVRVAGGRGSGRTRLLAEVAHTLAGEGWAVWHVPDEKRPYESLRPLFPGDDVESAVREGLAGLHAARILLVADGPLGPDRWSRALLDRESDRVPWLVSVDPSGEAEVRLAPLSAVALRALFVGPERLFHLPTDAAALLWRRTGGLPAAVVAELDGWTARGLAAWEGGRLRVTRPDLERIEAGAVPPVGLGELANRDEALDELLLWMQLAGPVATVDLLSRARAEPTWAVELQVEALEGSGAVHRGEAGALVPLVPPRYGDNGSDDRRHAIHAALADALPVGSPGRLAHLLAAGRKREVGEEAPSAARALLGEGRAAAAIGLLDEAYAGGLGNGREEGRPALGAALVRAAWADGGVDVLRRARHVAGRIGSDARVSAILDAHPALQPSKATLRAVGALAPHADPAVEVLRVGMLIAAAALRGTVAWEAALVEAERWAEATAEPEVHARALGWRADFLYARAEFAASAELAERAARLSPAVGERLAFLYRAATVYLEEAEVDRVTALGHEIRESAASRRMPLHEARGEWLLRVVAERTGAGGEVDEELVEAAEQLGVGSLTGLLVLTEARVAWRAGRLDRGAALAERAAGAFASASQRPGTACALALQVACGGAGSPADLLAEVDDLDRSDVSVEVIGLLASAGRLPPGDWVARVQKEADRLVGYRRDWPHGAMSVNLALALTRG